MLRNEGDSRFDYQTYGKRITVVRSFTAAGSNSYKIKNARGMYVMSILIKHIFYVSSSVNLVIRSFAVLCFI